MQGFKENQLYNNDKEKVDEELVAEFSLGIKKVLGEEGSVDKVKESKKGDISEFGEGIKKAVGREGLADKVKKRNKEDIAEFDEAIKKVVGQEGLANKVEKSEDREAAEISRGIKENLGQRGSVAKVEKSEEDEIAEIENLFDGKFGMEEEDFVDEKIQDKVPENILDIEEYKLEDLEFKNEEDEEDSSLDKSKSNEGREKKLDGKDPIKGEGFSMIEKEDDPLDLGFSHMNRIGFRPGETTQTVKARELEKEEEFWKKRDTEEAYKINDKIKESLNKKDSSLDKSKSNEGREEKEVIGNDNDYEFRVKNGETDEGVFWYEYSNAVAKKLKESGELEWGKERIYFDIPLDEMEGLRDLSFSISKSGKIPIAFKHLDIKKTNEIDLKEGSDITRFVANFASVEDARKFYEILKEDESYKKIKSDRNLDYHGFNIDGVAHYASGYREKREPLKRIIEQAEENTDGTFSYPNQDGSRTITISKEEYDHFAEQFEAMPDPKEVWENSFNTDKKDSSLDKSKSNEGREKKDILKDLETATKEHLFMSQDGGKSPEEVEEVKKQIDSLKNELESSSKDKIEEIDKKADSIKDNKEKTASEENLSEAEKELNNNREALAEEYSQLKEKTLGIFGSERIDNIEDAERIATIEDKYRESLRAYRLDLFKDSNDNQEKNEQILLQTIVGEATKFYDLKTQIRTERLGNTKVEKMVKSVAKIGNWYKKQPLKVKLAVSGVLLAGGVASGLAGGVAGTALVSGLFVGKLSQRILGGTATAVGLEGLIQRSQKKQENKETLKDFNPEKITELLTYDNAKLDKKLFDLEGSQKKKLFGRVVLAGTAGVLVGSGMVGKALSGMTGWFGLGGSAEVGLEEPPVEKRPFDFSKETLEQQDKFNGLKERTLSSEVNEIFKSGSTPDNSIIEDTKSIVENSETIIDSVEIPESITIKSGDSIWKVSEKWLEENGKLAGLNEEQKNYVIDSLKDKLVVGVENSDSLKVGQEIDFGGKFEASDIEEAVNKAKGLSGGELQNIKDFNPVEVTGDFSEKLIQKDDF